MEFQSLPDQSTFSSLLAIKVLNIFTMKKNQKLYRVTKAYDLLSPQKEGKEIKKTQEEVEMKNKVKNEKKKQDQEEK